MTYLRETGLHMLHTATEAEAPKVVTVREVYQPPSRTYCRHSRQHPIFSPTENCVL